ncbi:type I-E CRISPR-associated protein Cas6/Cse3/CasE [Halostreptopolyspora alba]|uniref:Type I-E CRISPR-associated protein Cas6/Cse3/CasE n=1 Tax=Halostreptopolyspora alba TaxID=2487137 RepID=A0A3N0EHC7_9ACTN|nr:type I-E CRISPR-associated protein Cas6/Cse3/CasE [Nocardiopsaceae bacterium YIM 96095]
MFITRFRVNRARLSSRKLLAEPQRLHVAVLQGFPDAEPTSDDGPRVLWRLDRGAKGEVTLYVVSPRRPDYTHLVEEAGWPTLENGWETRDYTPFLDGLREGDTWAFRLTANPVHHVRTDRPNADPERTKPTAHRTPRHQTRWLIEREERAGFRVVRRGSDAARVTEADMFDLMVHNQQRLDFSKNGGGSTKRVRLTTVTFDGRLEVTDPDALRRTLTRGLGRAKAYGCGLMTLAPVGTAT